MRKIGKLTVGALAFAMFGLTSCVDNELTPEVKAIYENQAKILSAKADYEAAVAALEGLRAKTAALKLKVAEAQTVADLEKAKNELAENKRAEEKAREAFLAEIQDLKKQAKEKSTLISREYLSQYLDELATLNGNKKTLADKKAKLAAKEADKETYIDKDTQLKEQDLEIKKAEISLEEAKKALTDLESIMSNPETAGGKALALNKERQALIKKNDSLDGVKARYEADKKELGDAVNDYATAESELNAHIAKVVSLNKELADLEADKAKLLAEGGAASVTYEQAVENKNKTTEDYNAKDAEYTRLQNLYTGTNPGDPNYKEMLDKLHDARVDVTTIDAQIATATADYTKAKTAYDDASAKHKATPDGKRVKDSGADKKAGNTTNETFYEVTAISTTGELTYGTTAYAKASDIPGEAASKVTTVPTDVTSITNVLTASPTTQKVYVNVAADDTVETHKEYLDRTFQAWKSAQEALADLNVKKETITADLAKLEEQKKSFDNDVEVKLAAAKKELEAAKVDKESAEKVLSTLDSIVSVNEGIVAKKKEIKEEEAKRDDAQAKFDDIKGKVDDAKLAEYNALLDKINEIDRMKELNDTRKDVLTKYILSYQATDLLASGDDEYKAVIKDLKEKIVAQKEAIIAAEKAVELAKNELEKIKVGEPIANYEAAVADLKAEIAKLEAEVEARTKLVESFKKLYEESLA